MERIKIPRILAVIIVLLSFAGCGAEEKDMPEGFFDMDAAARRIVFDGKEIPFPFTLADLGGEYSFANSAHFKSGRRHTLSTLARGGTDVATVRSEPLDRTEPQEAKIYKMEFIMTDISVDGIEMGMPIEAVHQKWGEPTRVNDTFAYTYKEHVYMVDWDNYVTFEENPDGEITNITIQYMKGLAAETPAP